MFHSRWIMLAAAGCVACASASAQEWKMAQVKLPSELKHPIIACTGEELACLRAAYSGSGPAHDVVAAMIAQADAAMNKPLLFPPRGGQHNQWYQCDTCQIALKTIDDTHHQCPQCKKVYSGEPYDDVLFSRTHHANIRAAYAAAWAYAVTGKAEYARLAADVLCGYAQRYGQYAYHNAARTPGNAPGGGRLFEQTLDEAYFVAFDIAPAADLVWDALSAEQRQAIREGLLLPMLVNVDRHQAGKGNWQTFHNAAMLWGGAVLNDASWVNKALSDPDNGFGLQMKVSVSSDGMWYENSWAYHFYTLSGLVNMAEGARRLGADLWSHPNFKKMFTLPARYTMPDGSLPRFGDDPGCQATIAPGLMECAYHAYRDSTIAMLLPSRPIWETVLLGRDANAPLPKPTTAASEVFRGAGHAVLRAQGSSGLAAVITFGPYGGFHGHFDKLSFVLFGQGRELGVDPGRAYSQAYRLPIHTGWYKATVAHNTVLVDGNSQEPAEGKLEFFAANADYAAVTASLALPAAHASRFTKSDPGVFRRTLCLTGSYALVFDVLETSQPQRFDWIYHNRARGVRCAQAQKPRPLDDRFSGREYINNVLGGEAAGPITVEFDDPNGLTRVMVAEGEAAEVRTGDGVGASVVDRVPLTIVTRRGEQVTFAAVIEPLAGGAKGRVKSVAARREGDDHVVTVASDAGEDTYTISPASVTITRDHKTLLSSE